MVFILLCIALCFLFFEQYSIASLFFLAGGWLSGWYFAHHTVAEECKKLGGFYVGKTVYRCTEIIQQDNTEG